MKVHQDDDIMIMEETKIHIKGKRTKRPRPSSALTLTIASTSTTSSTTTADSAPATNSNIDFTTISQNSHNNNNDEDVANCLILLAHGQGRTQNFFQTMAQPSQLYVFECKTCNRGFTSFQALGGHRASHNKPHKTPLNLIPLSCNPSGSTKGPKVHECSICGSDFASGQALGGHMRRHRSVMPKTTSTTTICNTDDEHHESKKHKTLVPLDLNLPAPIEDDRNEANFSSFGSSNQIIVFSTPSLVDCHF